ncbi:MAG TPA: hypothetical protein VM283_09650, partial [Armatimonadota bacterium]|nr:hypothetical protein [Armatimonadota bacterium]
MADLLKSISVLGAIAGGYATGQLQAQQARQQQEQQNLLQAMNLARTQSSLQTEALQQQQIRWDLEHALTPQQESDLGFQDWMRQMQQQRTFAATDRTREQEEAAGTAVQLNRLTAQASGLFGPAGVPTDYAQAQAAPLTATLPAPGPLAESAPQTISQRMTLPGQDLRQPGVANQPFVVPEVATAQGTQPVNLQAPMPPPTQIGVGQVPLAQATQEQLLSFGAREGAQFTPADGQILMGLPTAAERTAALSQSARDAAEFAVKLRKDLADIAATESQTEREERLFPLEMDKLIVELARARTLTDLDAAKIDELRQKMGREEFAYSLSRQMLASESPQAVQMGIAYLLGSGYSINDVGAVEAELRAQGYDT